MYPTMRGACQARPSGFLLLLTPVRVMIFPERKLSRRGKEPFTQAQDLGILNRPAGVRRQMFPPDQLGALMAAIDYVVMALGIRVLT